MENFHDDMDDNGRISRARKLQVSHIQANIVLGREGCVYVATMTKCT